MPGPEDGAAGSPQLHLTIGGPHPCAQVSRPKPGARRGAGARLSRLHLLCHWCSRFRGRRRLPLPRGAAAPPLPRGRGSLPGASAPTSPAPAWPWRPPPAPRKPSCARGPLAGRPAAPQPRPRRPAEPRPLTRPHHGGAATAPGHPQNGINERALEAAPSERGAGARQGCGASSGRPARAQKVGSRGERRTAAAGCQVRVPTQRPRWEEKRGGEGRGKRDPRWRFAGRPPPRPCHSPPRLPAPEAAGAGPLHLSPGSCLPQPGHAPQAPPRPAPLRCTAVPTAPPPAGGDVTTRPAAPPPSLLAPGRGL